VTSGVQEITATVETVDMTYRHLLVRGPQGNLITLIVDPSVRNLGQVRPGDRITLRYASAVAAQLAPPSAKPRNEVVRVGARTPEGARPGVVLGERRTVTVQVTGIDLASNTVSFVPPDGQPRTVVVRDPSMQDFLRHLKVGDRVDVTYAEAVAVSVEPGV
jgi:hypothetical protein